jgi:multicomponent K+:H+ antiporter subunit G
MSPLEQLPIWADALIALLLLASALAALVGALALVKFSDFYKRVHGPTKATTLGVGGVLIASSVYFSLRGSGLSLHEFLIALFLFITAPVSAHMLVKAAMHVARNTKTPT